MKRALTCVFAFAIVMLAASLLSEANAADQTPTDRVVVMYFHRTQRCPTCLKMGSYSEEAAKSGFVQQLKDGTVEFHYIDFQDKKNDALTKAYKINGPALLVARVSGSKVVEYKNLSEIWTKVADKAAFVKYVQGSVNAYQK